MKALRFAVVAAILAFASGCASTPQYDYSAFKAAKPKSILVLPPINKSPDVGATAAVWAQAVKPLAEAGYYVLPVAMVNEQLKQNGITTAEAAWEISAEKLKEVFGADAVLYLTATRYGTSFRIIKSLTEVAVTAALVDLNTGNRLWSGSAFATSADEDPSIPGGLAIMAAIAVVKQVVSSISDDGYEYAGRAEDLLFAVPRFHGILPGPRSEYYGQPMPTKR